MLLRDEPVEKIRRAGVFTDEAVKLEVRGCRVARERAREIAGRGDGQPAMPDLAALADGDARAAVLERSGRVPGFVLQVEALETERLAEAAIAQQRRSAFVERTHLGRIPHRQERSASSTFERRRRRNRDRAQHRPHRGRRSPRAPHRSRGRSDHASNRRRAARATHATRPGVDSQAETYLEARSIDRSGPRAARFAEKLTHRSRSLDSRADASEPVVHPLDIERQVRFVVVPVAMCAEADGGLQMKSTANRDRDGRTWNSVSRGGGGVPETFDESVQRSLLLDESRDVLRRRRR